MPGFDFILDQEHPIRLLKAMLKRDKIPHALLFTGIDGIGKRTSALAFSMACNCEFGQRRNAPAQETSENHLNEDLPDLPCDACRQCRRIKNGLHPDIIQIAPSGPYIRIDRIRSLIESLTMKPYENGKRIVIISDSQKMTPEAGNALLKVLEEPPDRTILILTAQQTTDLLPTIGSRCQQIRFNPISSESLELMLTGEHGQRPEVATVIAGMAKGSYAKSIALIKGNWCQRRDWLISAIGLDGPETADKKPLSEIFAFSEKLSQKKDVLEDSLDVLKSWLRDLVIYRHSPEKIVNRDLVEKIDRLAATQNMDKILQKIEAIQEVQKKIRANANLRITLDIMSMKLCNLV